MEDRLFAQQESSAIHSIHQSSLLHRLRLIAFAVLLAVLGLLAPLSASANQMETALKNRVETIGDNPAVSGVSLAAPDFIQSFYARRNHQPAWLGKPAAEQLFAKIWASEDHGFRLEDFHASAFAGLLGAARGGDRNAAAEFEIVATDAAIRLLHHLYFGKVNPERLDPDWNFERPMITDDPVALLSDYLANDGYGALAEAAAPKHPQYVDLQGALKQYREIAAAGGWPAVPSEKVLKPGEEDDRVPVLIERLAVEGYLPESSVETKVYDSAIEDAVKRFQTRNGLEADGVIGAKTFAALNATAEDRVNQIRLSMERARWIVRGLGDEFVLVNIAGAETYFSRGGKTIWRTRSITGQAYRKTPVFRDEISYMEFNPTWTVPVSIFRKDKLPRIRKDPGYLARGGYTVRDRDGRTISPSAVNWGARNPGVTLVQKPGPKNALGTVKFMFPNKYAVYLHDTDNRSLFDRAERNLSSGCVRLEDPYGFADLLMRSVPDWSHERRDAILASGKTTRIDLPRPVPVLLTYFTAWVDDGEVMFRRDIYDRDASLLKALDVRFRR